MGMEMLAVSQAWFGMGEQEFWLREVRGSNPRAAPPF